VHLEPLGPLLEGEELLALLVDRKVHLREAHQPQVVHAPFIIPDLLQRLSMVAQGMSFTFKW